MEPKPNLSPKQVQKLSKSYQYQILITQAEHRIGRQFGFDLGQLKDFRGSSKSIHVSCTLVQHVELERKAAAQGQATFVTCPPSQNVFRLDNNHKGSGTLMIMLYREKNKWWDTCKWVHSSPKEMQLFFPDFLWWPWTRLAQTSLTYTLPQLKGTFKKVAFLLGKSVLTYPIVRMWLVIPHAQDVIFRWALWCGKGPRSFAIEKKVFFGLVFGWICKFDQHWALIKGVLFLDRSWS